MGLSTTAAQPAVATVDIDNLTAASAGMDLLEQDVMSLQSMPLRARRVIVRLDSAVVVYHRTNLRVRTRTRVHDGFFAYVTFGPRAAGCVEGIQVRPGMMLVAEPETEAGFVVDPGYESVTLLVRPDVIRRHLQARQREHEFRAPRCVEVLSMNPARARALFTWGKRLTATAARNPESFREGRLERDAALEDLLDTLLYAMRAADTLELQGTEKTRRTHSAIVTHTERYVLERAGEPVHLTDLCMFTDVSERTLECAFKEVTGLTPMAYLIRLRLHRVRDALLVATPGSTQVSAEALKWGFWHFGEFSRTYKKCFGELPSQTLRGTHVPSAVGSNTMAAPDR